ncbi:TetR/AcrR family transcriptional regulator [Kineococcus terrestris]|uniref:TetR/AcrR family transcriptional regulator n=1 Tax=Kineococcus terrestris TaxID=2044856 RepID=UPI0034DB4C19
MTADRTGAGDPARTLALLWRDPDAVPRRGPRRSLDLDDVVAAATALADEHGLAALSMRRVAERLGVGAMSLYTYVADRAELLDLLVDAALAAAPREDTTGRPWRERVAALAEDERRLFDAHPWLAEVSTLRPPLGPGQTAAYEHQLAAFDGTGLDDVTVDACLTHLLVVVRACARDAAAARAAARADGTDEQWWERAGPLLARVLDPARYPRAVRVGAAAGAAHGSAHDPGHAHRFGVERVLDGVAALVEDARPVRHR